MTDWWLDAAARRPAAAGASPERSGCFDSRSTSETFFVRPLDRLEDTTSSLAAAHALSRAGSASHSTDPTPRIQPARGYLLVRAVRGELRLRRTRGRELEPLHRRMPLDPDAQHPAVFVVAVEHRPEQITPVEGEVRALERPTGDRMNRIPPLNGEQLPLRCPESCLDAGPDHDSHSRTFSRLASGFDGCKREGNACSARYEDAWRPDAVSPVRGPQTGKPGASRDICAARVCRRRNR